MTEPSGKNASRISSILGTWTAEMHAKASIGDYELKAYFMVHLMPDPMRGYGCSLPGCSELENKICVQNQTTNKKKCVSMEEESIHWSDLNAFMFFGGEVNAGFPFNVHKTHDTGGWVGPVSLVAARNTTDIGQPAGEDENGTLTVVDHYTARYVDSPATIPYLEFHENCSLFGPGDFDRFLGKTAIHNTVKGQYRPNDNTTNHSTPFDHDDPYAPYYKTCANGDVKSILPLYDFRFDVDQNGNEKMQIKLKYKILTIPKKTDIMYSVFPRFQKRVNRADRPDAHISGPYCYGNDPKRGYTFDLIYDSEHESDFLKVTHGCLEGLPCLPDAAKISFSNHGQSTIIHHKDKATTLNMGPVIFLSISLCIVSLMLIASLVVNFRQYRRADCEESEPQENPDHNSFGGDEFVNPLSPLAGLEMATNEENASDLAEPLLRNQPEDEGGEDNSEQVATEA